jgi:hypothetical protein
MATPSTRSKALTVAAFGARGTGKTAWVIQTINATNPTRLMVWDYKHDHSLTSLGTGFASWAAFVKECKKPHFQARYLVHPDFDPHEQFQAFCELAWREGNLTMFVDELGEVTKANKAPGAWRKCVNVGRSYDNGKKALSIIGANQRPAEVDKSFLANCDTIHTGRLGDIADAKRFASSWGIDAAELVNLPDLSWVEKRADTPEIFRGVLQFAHKRKVVTLNPKA